MGVVAPPQAPPFPFTVEQFVAEVNAPSAAPTSSPETSHAAPLASATPPRRAWPPRSAPRARDPSSPKSRKSDAGSASDSERSEGSAEFPKDNTVPLDEMKDDFGMTERVLRGEDRYGRLFDTTGQNPFEQGDGGVGR